MTRRKKRKSKGSLFSVPCFVFTPETIAIAREALKILEEPMSRANHQEHKIAFAAKEIRRVKCKLDAMEASLGNPILITFDSNEKALLVAALQMYRFDLSLLPPNSKRERAMRQCGQMIASFSTDSPSGGKPTP